MLKFLIVPAIMFAVACIGYIYTVIIHFNDNKK